MVRVLVVEDQQPRCEPVSPMLRSEGFEVIVTENGPQALALFDHDSPDLVLLDLMLPQMSGVDLCHDLRARSDVPIIIVSATGSEIDRVVGLEIGADDYLTRPYSMRELLARIRAVLRRSPGRKVVGAAPRLVAGTIEMDVERHRVTVDGAEISLTIKEFQVLELLLRNAGRVLSRAQVIDRVWGPGYVGDMRTLDVHVKRIRTKIEKDPAAPRHLLTVRGVGFKLQP